MKDPLTRIKSMLDNPTKGKWDQCCQLVNLYKDVACECGAVWDIIDSCVAYMRTWYIERAKIQGMDITRRFYGPMESSYFAWRRMLARAPVRPSIPAELKGPMPGKDSIDTLQFLGALNTSQTLRATFARLETYRPGHNPAMLFGIPCREGAICGLKLHEHYVQGKIPRASWALDQMVPEWLLLEDLVLFQIITSPGIKSRTLIRMAPVVNAFLRRLTLEETYIALWTVVKRLERGERIYQPAPNRWTLTYGGRVCAWSELPAAWESFISYHKRPPKSKSAK